MHCSKVCLYRPHTVNLLLPSLVSWGIKVSPTFFKIEAMGAVCLGLLSREDTNLVTILVPECKIFSLFLGPSVLPTLKIDELRWGQWH